MGWLIAGIAVIVLFIVYLLLVLPQRADEAKFAPFQGLMAAHRGLYEKDQSVPENSLEAFRRAAEYGCGVTVRAEDPEALAEGMRALEEMPPEELAELAAVYRPRGNIGVAFTYNEPLVCWEYVRDTARLVHERGMLNVLVTNGCAETGILEQLAPYIDAMNIDLKGFTDRYYKDVLGGDRQTVMNFIQEAVKRCHVELTTLIVPGENDNVDEMLALSEWVAGLKNVRGGKQGREIPLHISRFFPRHHMTDRNPTDINTLYSLVQAAQKHLLYVYPGNV